MKLWTALRVDECPHPCVISLVGAGGKSTLLARLAAEAEERGVRTVVTSTTHLWRTQLEAFSHHAFVDTEERALALARQGPFPLALARLPLPLAQGEQGKVVGLPPEWIDALAAQGRVDLIIVEADGSRERPLKAPTTHEPVVPSSTHLFVTVAGWQGVGTPLTEEHVHRAEVFARLAKRPLRRPVSPEALARVLLHPQGGLKGKPPHARAVLVLNQVDTEDHVKSARRLARQMVRAPGRRVFEIALASLLLPSPVHEVHGRVGAVVLAAGGATRFGRAKQVMPWRGKPLILHVLDAVASAQVDQIVIVLGAYRREVEPIVRGWVARYRGDATVRVVVNRAWQEGQSTSVRAGLDALEDVHAALFPLADQPRVPAALLNALIERHRQTLASVVVPRYGGRPGAPVLFDSRLFSQLRQLRGDTGGRVLVRKFASRVHWLDWDDSSAAWDVDTPEDLQSL